jgi:hypothetical protein
MTWAIDYKVTINIVILVMNHNTFELFGTQLTLVLLWFWTLPSILVMKKYKTTIHIIFCFEFTHIFCTLTIGEGRGREEQQHAKSVNAMKGKADHCWSLAHLK